MHFEGCLLLTSQGMQVAALEQRAAEAVAGQAEASKRAAEAECQVEDLSMRAQQAEHTAAEAGRRAKDAKDQIMEAAAAAEARQAEVTAEAQQRAKVYRTLPACCCQRWSLCLLRLCNVLVHALP